MQVGRVNNDLSLGASMGHRLGHSSTAPEGNPQGKKDFTSSASEWLGW